MTDAERIKQLDAENIILRDALFRLKNWSEIAKLKLLDVDNNPGDLAIRIANYALKECQNSHQFFRERDADLAVIECAKKIASFDNEYQTDKQKGTWSDFYAYWVDEKKRRMNKLQEALDSRDRVYKENK